MLEHLSDAELEAEMQRRKKAKRLEMAPQRVPNPDLTAVLGQCDAMIEEMASPGGIHDDDLSDHQHYLWEMMMQALYGPKFFDWWNRRESEKFDEDPDEG
jgi:hypothetical protein